ncbi:MAG: lysophospholipid acyltransferase family protein [Parvibaculales bacterium]
MVRETAKQAGQTAKKAAQSMAARARAVELPKPDLSKLDLSKVDPRKVDLPRFDWERGRFVKKDAAPALSHGFQAEEVAWPLRLLGWLVNRYIRLCEVTSSVSVAGDGPFLQLQKANQPCILLVWHGRNFQAIPMARLFHSPITALTSRSRDGAMIANVIKPFGYEAIQGSGTGTAAKKKTNPKKRGAQAFRGMLKHLKNGEMVLATADVPPGPVFETGPGMVKLAAMSGAAIIPIGASFSPEIPIAGTWDKSRLPVPFAHRSLVFGEPVFVAREVAGDDDKLTAACQTVTDALNKAQGEAESLLGK